MVKREFQYSESNSNKFWNITLEERSHTVQYGRIGTVGQTKAKEFDTEAAATKAYEALVSSKIKEGYIEITSNQTIIELPTIELPIKTSEELPASIPLEPIPPKNERPDNLGLSAEDWYWASWRKLEPLTRPVPPPFNKAQALEKLRGIKVTQRGWKWGWEELHIPITMTRVEAHFWWTAITRSRQYIRAQLLCQGLAELNFDDNLCLEGVIGELKNASYIDPSEIVFPLFNLFDQDKIVDLVLFRNPQSKNRTNFSLSMYYLLLVNGFHRCVLPYLNKTEIEGLQQRLLPELSEDNWPIDAYEVPIAFLLGAYIGMHQPLQTMVESWPDDKFPYQPGWYHDYYQRPQEIIFGLASPELIEKHMRRLKLRLRTPDYIKGWLANTELSALDAIRDSILAETTRETAIRLINTFAQVIAPEVAPHMLELKLSSKVSAIARDWLDNHPAETIEGLAPLLGGRGKIPEAVREHLRLLKKNGYEDMILSVQAKLKPEIAERLKTEILNYREKYYPSLDEDTTPEWLKLAITQSPKSKKFKLPAWIRPKDLPPILIDEFCLNEQQQLFLLAALQESTLELPHPGIIALKTHEDEVDTSSLETFSQALFQLWLTEGAPSKEKWAMNTLGLLGGDETAKNLTSLIMVWPGEGQHQRAVNGLECLRAIGSDIALIHINKVAQKVKFKGLKDRAQECLNQIAQARGLTRAQLEDRIVPDFDLDENGTTIFDFGSRKFYLEINPDLTPEIKYEDGKVKSDLPKPNSSDNLEQANQEIERWKTLKKQLRETFKLQVRRLEQALVTCRRWSVAEFEILLAFHPLMAHLAQSLVWGQYNNSGNLSTTFIVTAEHSFKNVTGETITLNRELLVGIVHPLHLSETEKGDWLNIFPTAQPFPQLTRSIYQLEKDEFESSEITRFEKIKVPAIALVGTLEKLGWRRGIPQDAGVFYEHSKPFEGLNITAVVQYDGVPIGYMEGWEDQAVERCFFLSGLYSPEIYPYHQNKIPLGRVEPLVVSEVLNELYLIASKKQKN